MSRLDNNMMEDNLDREEDDFEFEGCTVNEAIDKAVKELNLPRKDIVVKIVCEEKKGLFGMEGAKPAKIKVTKKK